MHRGFWPIARHLRGRKPVVAAQRPDPCPAGIEAVHAHPQPRKGARVHRHTSAIPPRNRFGASAIPHPRPAKSKLPWMPRGPGCLRYPEMFRDSGRPQDEALDPGNESNLKRNNHPASTRITPLTTSERMVCTGFQGGWQVASSISPKISRAKNALQLSDFSAANIWEHAEGVRDPGVLSYHKR
jgi:hypothetical protein